MFESIRKNKWIFFLEGALLLILGVIAISIPQLTTLALGLVLGIILIISGIQSLYKSYKVHEEKNLFWSTLFSGILSITIGILLLRYVDAGIYFLTTLLILYLGFEGISKVIASMILSPLKFSGLLMFSGIVSLFLAILVMSELPGTATWFLGLIFGVNLIISGISYMALALGLRHVEKQVF